MSGSARGRSQLRQPARWLRRSRQLRQAAGRNVRPLGLLLLICGVVIGSSSGTARADVTIENEDRPTAPTRLVISGTITKTDVLAVSAAVLHSKSGLPAGAPELIVGLNSTGGDIDAAMAIGRMIRKKESLVGTLDRVAPLLDVSLKRIPPPVCASACVLVLSSGKRRLGGTLVGIHRPYSVLSGPEADNPASPSYASAVSRIRDYLEEMGMPARLFAEMMQVPAKGVRWLTDGNQEDFGMSNSTSRRTLLAMRN